MEAPLLSIDTLLEEFAGEHGLKLSKNDKGNLERSIRWGDNPICLIQIYLEEEKGPTWNLWLCCFQDRGNSRYWRRDTPIRDETVEIFRERLRAVLENSFTALEQWKATPEQLEFATKLSALP